jgi:hypothetical protein
MLEIIEKEYLMAKKSFFTEQINEKDFEILTNLKTTLAVKNYVLQSKPWLGEYGSTTGFPIIEKIKKITNYFDIQTHYFKQYFLKKEGQIFLVTMCAEKAR